MGPPRRDPPEVRPAEVRPAEVRLEFALLRFALLRFAGGWRWYALPRSAPLRSAPMRSAPMRSAAELSLALQAFQISTPCWRSARCSGLALLWPAFNDLNADGQISTGMESAPCSHLGMEHAEAGAGAMLVALAGLSAQIARHM